MSLRQRLEDDLLEAIKSKEELKRDVLRGLKSALKNYEIDAQITLTDSDTERVIAKEVKNRKESIEAYQQAGKAELAETEKREMEILQTYLPDQLSETELIKIIDKVIGQLPDANRGQLMGKLSQELKGQADMGQVAKIVSQKLD